MSKFSLKSSRVAFGGLAAALSVVLLLANNIFPTATLALTAAAAVVVFIISVEFNTPLAVAVYLSSAVLSAVLVTANLNVFWLYTIVFGIYSVIKKPIDMLKNNVVKHICKITFSLVAYIGYVCVLFFIMGLADVLSKWTFLIIIGSLAFVAVFLVYDRCLTRLAQAYYSSFRSKVIK